MAFIEPMARSITLSRGAPNAFNSTHWSYYLGFDIDYPFVLLQCCSLQASISVSLSMDLALRRLKGVQFQSRRSSISARGKIVHVPTRSVPSERVRVRRW